MSKWLKLIAAFVVGVTLLLVCVQLKSYGNSRTGHTNFPLPSDQNFAVFVPADAAPSTSTVTSSPSGTHGIQKLPGKPPQENTSNATLKPPVSAKPKPVQHKLRSSCYCNSSGITVLNVSELVQQFGPPPQHLTNHFATDYIADKYTILIPTYNRIDGLFDLLNHYCNATNVHKILFVWHNVGFPVPKNVTEYGNCSIPFKFLTPDHNLLSDRFRLTPDVETEAVLTLDDDSIIPYHGLRIGFETWKAYKHLIVGFMECQHTVRDNGHYQYEHLKGKDKKCYSSVLTGLTFLHRKYLDMYFADSVKKIQHFVDKHVNGEDLMMNAVVSNYTSQFKFGLPCHALVVDVQRRELTKDDWAYDQGLSRKGDFFPERDQCLDLIAEVYGGAIPMTCCHYWLRG